MEFPILTLHKVEFFSSSSLSLSRGSPKSRITLRLVSLAGWSSACILSQPGDQPTRSTGGAHPANPGFLCSGELSGRRGSDAGGSGAGRGVPTGAERAEPEARDPRRPTGGGRSAGRKRPSRGAPPRRKGRRPGVSWCIPDPPQ